VEAITRAAHAGVRTIEHGNLIDEASAKLMASKGMFLIANLVTYYEMKKRAAEYGMSSDMLAKNDLVIDGGLRSLEICKRAGVPVAYGTDLLGPAAGRAVARVHHPLGGAKADRDHPRRHPDRGQIVRQVDKLGCLKPAPSPTSSSSTAIRSRTSASAGAGQVLAVIMKGGASQEPLTDQCARL
jgi:hypothetical protein